MGQVVSGSAGQPAPSVSVVVPTRDRPESLAVAVTSVLEQDGDLEVIVIDDGSDPPVAAVGPLVDPRVRFVRNDHPEGPARARNIGLDHANGDYVAFLDDDDVWLPGKINRCLHVAEVTPEAGVITHRTVDDIREVGAAATGDVEVVADPLSWFGSEQTPHLNGLFVRAGLAREVRFDETFDAAADVDFVIELARRSPVVRMGDVLAVRGPDDGVTDVGIDRRIAARKRLRHKHPDVLYSGAESRSFYHLRLGHLYRRMGRRVRAIRSFITAIRHRATAPAPWRAIGLTMLPARTVTRWSIKRRIHRGQSR